MTDQQIAAPGRPINHWLAFWLVYAVGVAATAAITGNLSYGVGYMSIPAVLGYFATRKATTLTRLLPGYALFIAFAAVLLYQQVQSDIRDGQKNIYGGCMRSQAAAKFSQSQLEAYCTCISGKIAPSAEWEVVNAKMAWKSEPAPLQDNPAMMSAVNQAATECAPTLTK